MYWPADGTKYSKSELNFWPSINQHVRSDCAHRMADADTWRWKFRHKLNIRSVCDA
jgi:hypothetical protein